MPLSVRQTGVLKGMLLALAVAGAALAAAAAVQPFPPAAVATLGGRLTILLAWEILVILPLGVSIGLLARHRFFTPEDMDGSGLTPGTDRARMLQAVLHNTLEQTTLAFGAHLLWAAVMPPAWLGAVPAAAVMFITGRIAFFLGYASGAPARAFGFALTFYPSLIMLLAVLLREAILVVS